MADIDIANPGASAAALRAALAELARPAPFVGNQGLWMRPALNIGGPSSTFNTWLNQGSVVAADHAGGLPLALSIPAGEAGLQGMLKPIGPPPWTLTVFLAANSINIQGDAYASLILYNLAEDKAVEVVWATIGGNGLSVQYVHPTATDTVAASPIGVGLPSSYVAWLRVEHDGTNLIFSQSLEGVAFLPYGTLPAGEFASSFDYAGFGVDQGFNGGGLAFVGLWNWVES